MSEKTNLLRENVDRISTPSAPATIPVPDQEAATTTATVDYTPFLNITKAVIL
jgi:hypothetical protein